MKEIIPAVTQPLRRAESCLHQWLIPAEQSTSCLCRHLSLKDLTTQNLVSLFSPLPALVAGGAAGCLEHNAAAPAPSSGSLKQSHGQQRYRTRSYSTEQIPAYPGIRAACFPDQKSGFTIVSTVEPRSSGRASWLLFCFVHHQPNCQLISYCGIFIASSDLWGRMNIFYFPISCGSCRLPAGGKKIWPVNLANMIGK